MASNWRDAMHQEARRRKRRAVAKNRRKHSKQRPEPMKYRDICEYGRAPSKSDVKGRAKRAIDLWDSLRGW